MAFGSLAASLAMLYHLTYQFTERLLEPDISAHQAAVENRVFHKVVGMCVTPSLFLVMGILAATMKPLADMDKCVSWPLYFGWFVPCLGASGGFLHAMAILIIRPVREWLRLSPDDVGRKARNRAWTMVVGKMRGIASCVTSGFLAGFLNACLHCYVGEGAYIAALWFLQFALLGWEVPIMWMDVKLEIFRTRDADGNDIDEDHIEPESILGRTLSFLSNILTYTIIAQLGITIKYGLCGTFKVVTLGSTCAATGDLLQPGYAEHTQGLAGIDI